MRHFENNYVVIDIDATHSLLKFCFTTEQGKPPMQESDYREALTAYRNLFAQHQYTYLFVDNRESTFVITPELQAWVATEIAPRTTSLKKMAFVVSPYIFTQVSVEQMMEEKGIADNYAAPHYFEDEETALAWLLAGGE
jgi:hypothetical protein